MTPPLLLEHSRVNCINNKHYHHIVTISKTPIQSKEKDKTDKGRYNHQMAQGGKRMPQSWRTSKTTSALSSKRTHTELYKTTKLSSCRRSCSLLPDMMAKIRHTHGDTRAPSTERVHRIGSWQPGVAFGVVILWYTITAPYSWSSHYASQKSKTTKCWSLKSHGCFHSCYWRTSFKFFVCFVVRSI